MAITCKSQQNEQKIKTSCKTLQPKRHIMAALTPEPRREQRTDPGPGRLAACQKPRRARVLPLLSPISRGGTICSGNFAVIFEFILEWLQFMGLQSGSRAKNF